jgi:hypothetical protein
MAATPRSNAHDHVAEQMRLDRESLMLEFGLFTSDKEWRFVFEGLAFGSSRGAAPPFPRTKNAAPRGRLGKAAFL